MTLTAFLDWENAQVEKHELVRGEVLAMMESRRTDLPRTEASDRGAFAFDQGLQPRPEVLVLPHAAKPGRGVEAEPQA
jgi:hypothetical protein